MKYTFPADYDARTCYLVPINASLIPFVAGSLRFFEKRGTWETEDDFERAYPAFAELQAVFMKLCIEQLIESNNRIYRLLDTIATGREYSVVSEDPLVIEPEIPLVPIPGGVNEDGLLYKLDRNYQRFVNSIDGEATPMFNMYTENGIRQLIEFIVEQEGWSDEEKMKLFADIAEILFYVA